MTSIPKLPSLKEKPSFTLESSLTQSQKTQSSSHEHFIPRSTSQLSQISRDEIKKSKRSHSSLSSHSKEDSVMSSLDMNIGGTHLSGHSLTKGRNTSVDKEKIDKSESTSASTSGRSTKSSTSSSSSRSNKSSDTSISSKLNKDRKSKTSISSNINSTTDIIRNSNVEIKKVDSFQSNQSNQSNHSNHSNKFINPINSIRSTHSTHSLQSLDDNRDSSDLLSEEIQELDTYEKSDLRTIIKEINEENIEDNANDSYDSDDLNYENDYTSDNTFITAISEGTLPPELEAERESQRREIEEALKLHKQETEELRKQLSEFLDDVKAKKDEDGNPLVEFPKAYDSIIDFLKLNGNLNEIPNEIVKQFIEASNVTDEEAMSEISENESLDVGMNRIRKLDLLLHESEMKSLNIQKKINRIIKRDQKNAQLRKEKKIPLRKMILSSTDKDEFIDDSAEENEVAQVQLDSTKIDVPFPEEDLILTKYQQERIDKLLSDENIELGIIPSGEGFNPSDDDLKRLSEIDERLKEIDPEMFKLPISIDNVSASHRISSLEDDILNIQDSSNLNEDLNSIEEIQDVRDPSHPLQLELLNIDEKISKLYSEREITMPSLTEEQLQKLLQDIKL